ncbi:MAG: transglutaminase family protein [Burkholderiales bacterium]|nr:transglutaminase family protein [Phycisphaerae bacterium]
MNYSVKHETQYRYGESVSLCHNVLRLRPRDDEHQTCRQHTLTVSPVPVSERTRIDFFGNQVTSISLQEPHDKLTITATSEVHVIPRPQVNLAVSIAWDEAREIIAKLPDPGAIAARQFTFDSPHVVRSDALAEFARSVFTPRRPLLECVMELTLKIYDEFTFIAGETDVGTSVAEVLQTRRGVCQDFAHLQIGCLRSLGLAAQYVSGYIATDPPPGRARLLGCDASHAWLSVYAPGLGWFDFDPTNGIMPTSQHITLACARDYEDVGPVRGIVLGGKRHSLGVAVDVVPLEVH